MHLQIGKTRGRKYLVIVHRYKDPVTKKRKHKTIKSLGYLDDLKREYPDPIAHFRAVVDEMNRAAALEKQAVKISLDTRATLGLAGTNRKNIGYAAISKLYHQLGLHDFFSDNSRGFGASFDASSIMKLLVYSRILFPASVEGTYEQKGQYFEDSDFALDDVYRCLAQVSTLKDGLQKHLHRQMKSEYGRKTELVFYSSTSYYWETDRQDETGGESAPQEHYQDPIIRMGLFLDTEGIPIMYDLIPSTTDNPDGLSLMLDRTKEEHEIGRIVVIEDKGTDMADSIACCLARGDGYVYSQTLHIASEELKAYALDPHGYAESGDGFVIKSRVHPREVDTGDALDGSTTIRVFEKQVILYSPEEDWIAKEERKRAISEINDLAFDPDTGETATQEGWPTLDEATLREGEKFDGYWSIVTSEVQKDDEEIVRIYRGLGHIEEAFEVTRGSIQTRPLYLSRENYTKTHFFVSFVALVLARLLALTLGNEFPVSQVKESLRRASGSLLDKNWYMFDYADEVTAAITKTLGVDLTRKYLRLEDIESIIGETEEA